MEKKFGLALLVLGILIAILLVLARIKEQNYINLIVERNGGSCILEDGTCLHDAHNLWPYIFGGIISGASIVFGIMLFIQKGTEAKPLKKIPQLIGDEKIIYDEISKERSIFQSTLVEKTGLSKVKVTRILDKLEGKGIIERKRRGMTNMVILK